MGSSFNESFVETKRFVGPMNSAQDPLNTTYCHKNALLKKKKKRERQMQCFSALSKWSPKVDLQTK